MKKQLAILLLVVALVMVAAGCGKKNASEQLENALIKMATADTYEYEGSLTMNFDSDDLQQSNNPEMAMAASLLNGSEIKYKGAYNKKTNQQSLTLDLAIKGDMSFTFSIPFIMDKEDLYVKIPQVAFLPIPKNLVGKYVHITAADLKKMDPNAPTAGLNTDPEKQSALLKELFLVLNKHYKDDKNLTIVEENKPEGVADLLQYSVTNENVEEFVTKLAKTVIPELLSVMSKPEFSEMTGIQAAEIQKYNDSLKGFDSGLQDFKKTTSIKEIKSQVGMNKEGFMNYFKQVVDFDVNDTARDNQFKLKVLSETRMSKFNDSTVTVTLPDKSATVTLEQAQQALSQFSM